MTERPMDALLRQLNRKDVVDWLPEMKDGRAAYDALLTAARSDKLKENHSRNVLHALFCLRTHGPEGQVVELLIERLSDPRKKVRSEAAKLVAGLLKFGEVKPSPDCVQRLRAAVSLGVAPEVRDLVEHVAQDKA